MASPSEGTTVITDDIIDEITSWIANQINEKLKEHFSGQRPPPITILFIYAPVLAGKSDIRSRLKSKLSGDIYYIPIDPYHILRDFGDAFGKRERSISRFISRLYLKKLEDSISRLYLKELEDKAKILVTQEILDKYNYRIDQNQESPFDREEYIRTRRITLVVEAHCLLIKNSDPDNLSHLEFHCGDCCPLKDNSNIKFEDIARGVFSKVKIADITDILGYGTEGCPNRERVCPIKVRVTATINTEFSRKLVTVGGGLRRAYPLSLASLIIPRRSLRSSVEGYEHSIICGYEKVNRCYSSQNGCKEVHQNWLQKS